MRSLPAVVVLLALAVAGAVLAAPASAHAQWLGSDPEEGSVLAGLPAAVTMTYSEAIAPEFVDTAVVTPGGDAIPTEGTADGVDVVVDLAGSADVAAVADQAGEWQLVARVVSADGHPVEHTTTFEVETTPVAGQPTAGLDPTAVAAPSLEAVPEPAPTAPAAEASPVSSDPMVGVTEGLPGWAVPLLVLAALGAGAAAVVVHLRRRPPEA